jgi:isochorismate hydrolase
MYSSWNEMYELYLRNIKTMHEYYIGYLDNMKALNKSFVQTTDKVNEESGKSNENVSSYYITYIEAWQKMTRQWMNAFWGPYLQGVQAQENRVQ